MILASCRTPAADEALPCSLCILEDENNYSWTGALDAAVFELEEGQDALLDWSALTVDMFGDALDPLAGVEELVLLALPGMEPDELEQAIAHDDLQQSDAALFVFCTPVDARCRLSDFTLFGNDLDVEQYFAEGTGTWLAALLTPQVTIATVLFLLPSAEPQDPVVTLVDGSSQLAVDIDLGSLTPVTVPLGESFTIDWSALTVDGLGNPLSVTVLDRLMVGRFDADLESLEQRGPGLLVSADELWTMDVDGATADLGFLCQETSFCGVDHDSIWLLALSCSTCLNPAPRFVTRLMGSTAQVAENP